MDVRHHRGSVRYGFFKDVREWHFFNSHPVNETIGIGTENRITIMLLLKHRCRLHICRDTECGDIVMVLLNGSIVQVRSGVGLSVIDRQKDRFLLSAGTHNLGLRPALCTRASTSQKSGQVLLISTSTAGGTCNTT